MLEKIVRSNEFKENLSKILFYIAKDSKNRANNFKNSLKKELYELTFMPLKYRQSIYFNQENIRDFIFKGYCIPYVIDEENKRLILLDIIKWEER
ncbi:MAG: type II toxin-antitoxin system RelE/ParE family toxin [Sulfurimonas sp.]|jgi:plasmid stabilization system protein ParE